jgi:hypothetical protein
MTKPYQVSVANFSTRAAKYREQCAATGQKIEQKHITKLNSYANDPENCVARAQKSKYHIKPGTQLVKKYKGREYIVTATGSSEFKYKDRAYRTLSAIATEICGHKVSGYDFFGLNNNK